MYKTNCPNCGGEHLGVHGRFAWAPLFEEGFYHGDAEETSEEMVECRDCGQEFSLEDLEINGEQPAADDGSVGEMIAGVFPFTLQCKNPHCGKTFMSDEATYVAVVDVYFCPHCGGTDVT